MKAIDQIFGEEGSLQRVLADYEPRPGQEKMALAVAQALSDGHNLLVEAATGTGKSLAYLAPVVQSGLRVIVSTGTRSLQDQLVQSDLPLLERAVGEAIPAVVLKGVGNYVCRRKLAAYARQNDGDATLASVQTWVETTSTGDISELSDVAEDSPIWAQVTTTPELRLGSRCPFHNECFVTRARRGAEESSLVVVNHHLFFSDLRLKDSSSSGGILPHYDAVVFDEAHQLEEVMTSHFGYEVSCAQVDALARDWLLADGVPKFDKNGVNDLVVASFRFFSHVRRRLQTLVPDHNGDRVLQPEDLFDGELRQDWFFLDRTLEALERTGLRRNDMDATSESIDDSEWELARLTDRCRHLRDALAGIADRAAGAGKFVYWCRVTQSRVALHASPIAVDSVLQQQVIPGIHSVVLASATLRVAGEFAHVRDRLGLGDDLAHDITIDSPFDYERQCMLYLPRDIPDPRDKNAQEARHQRMAELVQLTDGHAFVLFTSHNALARCYRALKHLVDQPLLCQGQAPKSALLSTFRTTPRCILLATSSFWEGVDVPGPSLRHVLIDKLPFDVPTDPLNHARMQELADNGYPAFENYQLPRAIIAFRQGFGRLIRRGDDRGVVSVLDPRIVTRRYGRIFLDSLPPVRRTSSFEQVRRWWHEAQ